MRPDGVVVDLPLLDDPARVAVVVQNGLSRVNRRDERAYFYDLSIRFGDQIIESRRSRTAMPMSAAIG